MTSNGHENIHPEAPAEQADLASLFIQTAGWLKRNGSELINPEDKILGQHNGLPVTEGTPHLQYTIPGDIVRQHASRTTAEVLDIGEELTLIYWQPHYTPYEDYDEELRPDECELMRPRCDFLNEKDRDVLDSEALTIELHVDEDHEQTYVSGREIFKDPPKPTGTTPVRDSRLRLAQVVVHFESQTSSRDAGTEVITMREYKALDEILDDLNRMKQAIDTSAAGQTDRS